MESSIYAKSRLLYGLNWAKEHIVRADEVIICEGYTDVMGYARAEIPRAVATCGTALTEDHVKILKRFASRIVLSFDADAAGQAAAERFLRVGEGLRRRRSRRGITPRGSIPTNWPNRIRRRSVVRSRTPSRFWRSVSIERWPPRT